MNKAAYRDAREAERVNSWSDGFCHWDQLHLCRPHQRSNIPLCVCVWCLCEYGEPECLIWLCLFSWVSYSKFHTLILSFPWQPCVTGAAAHMNVFVHMSQGGRERETGRGTEKEGEPEKEWLSEPYIIMDSCTESKWRMEAGCTSGEPTLYSTW